MCNDCEENKESALTFWEWLWNWVKELSFVITLASLSGGFASLAIFLFKLLFETSAIAGFAVLSSLLISFAVAIGYSNYRGSLSESVKEELEKRKTEELEKKKKKEKKKSEKPAKQDGEVSLCEVQGGELNLCCSECGRMK